MSVGAVDGETAVIVMELAGDSWTAVSAVFFGEPNPVAEWQPLFGKDSQPVNDSIAYLPLA